MKISEITKQPLAEVTAFVDGDQNKPVTAYYAFEDQGGQVFATAHASHPDSYQPVLTGHSFAIDQAWLEQRQIKTMDIDHFERAVETTKALESLVASVESQGAFRKTWFLRHEADRADWKPYENADYLRLAKLELTVGFGQLDGVQNGVTHISDKGELVRDPDSMTTIAFDQLSPKALNQLQTLVNDGKLVFDTRKQHYQGHFDQPHTRLSGFRESPIKHETGLRALMRNASPESFENVEVVRSAPLRMAFNPLNIADIDERVGVEITSYVDRDVSKKCVSLYELERIDGQVIASLVASQPDSYQVPHAGQRFDIDQKWLDQRTVKAMDEAQFTHAVEKAQALNGVLHDISRQSGFHPSSYLRNDADIKGRSLSAFSASERLSIAKLETPVDFKLNNGKTMQVTHVSSNGELIYNAKGLKSIPLALVDTSELQKLSRGIAAGDVALSAKIERYLDEDKPKPQFRALPSANEPGPSR